MLLTVPKLGSLRRQAQATGIQSNKNNFRKARQRKSWSVAWNIKHYFMWNDSNHKTEILRTIFTSQGYEQKHTPRNGDLLEDSPRNELS